MCIAPRSLEIALLKLFDVYLVTDLCLAFLKILKALRRLLFD